MKFPITSDCSIVISGILLAQTLVPRRVSSQYRVGPVRQPTWREGSFGTHAGDPGYIIQVLSEKLDKFLDWAVRWVDDTKRNCRNSGPPVGGKQTLSGARPAGTAVAGPAGEGWSNNHLWKASRRVVHAKRTKPELSAWQHKSEPATTREKMGERHSARNPGPRSK